VEDESQVLEGVKTALDLGADINAVNKAGLTALRYAEKQGFTQVIELLKSHGAKETPATAEAR
jgi:ankyrin repeat protein